jgi:hypothetical protein
VTIEERLEEFAKTNAMLMEVLEARGIDVSGGGSKNHGPAPYRCTEERCSVG